MFETLDRLVLAGLGALSMTRERAESMFDQAVQRGEEVRTNQDRYVKDLMDAAARTRTNLEDLVAKQVHSAMVTMNLPTREDLTRIEDKLDLLLAKQTTTVGPL